MTLANTAMGALAAASMPLLATLDPTGGSDPALIIFGREISEALAFDRILGVMTRLFVLWLGLKCFDNLVPRAARWRLGIAHSLEAWAPTVRLTVGGLMAVVIIDAVTPDEPQARALGANRGQEPG